MLAFERHATSKIKNAEDLLSVSTLGFRGEALPSIASVSRLRLETRAPEEPAGTVIEINGGRIARVEEAGLPPGTSITVRDLFFNTPARKKFLKAESTELSHIASLVTHYALAHPDKHFELHSATNAMVAGKDFGDFIVWRRDDVPAYQLAVVADDAAMGITEIVRGADLLKSTARQILLYRTLDFAIPDFYHCDLVRDEAGVRLAKRHDSLSVRKLREMGWTAEEVRAEVGAHKPR